MPSSSGDIQKLYYSISEVAELVDLEAHVLRYWEGEFDQLKPRKNRAGRRVYTDDDVETVRRIKELVRDEKYTLEGARQALTREGEARSAQAELRDLRTFLEGMLKRL